MFVWLIWALGLAVAISGQYALRSRQPGLIVIGLLLSFDLVASWLIHMGSQPPARPIWQIFLDLGILFVLMLSRHHYKEFPRLLRFSAAGYFTMIALNAILIATHGRTDLLCSVLKAVIFVTILITNGWTGQKYARVAHMDDRNLARHRVAAGRGHGHLENR